MSECQHCSLTPEEHTAAAEQTLTDFALMTMLASRFPELRDTLDRVVQGWRGHALPECDPLAIS